MEYRENSENSKTAQSGEYRSILPSADARRLALSNVNPLIQFKSVGELEADERQRQEDGEPKRESIVVDALASYLLRLWCAARDNRNNALGGNGESYDSIMLECERQRRGEYSAERISQLRKTGGSTVYVQATAEKCMAAQSWIKDTLNFVDEKPWALEPTPKPSINPAAKQQCYEQVVKWAEQIIQERGSAPNPDELESFKSIMQDKIENLEKYKASLAADNMESLIEDQLREGGFNPAFDQFLYDLVTYPFACLKGPVVRRQERLVWEEQMDGSYKPVKKNQLAMQFERVSPYNLYFSPNMMDVNRGYLFERQKLQRSDLIKLKGTKGYSSDNIDKVLNAYGEGGLIEWVNKDWEKMLMEGRSSVMTPQTSNDIQIDALEFHGSVQGRVLKSWGIDGADSIEDLNEYNVCSILIGQYVIKAVINDELGDQKPYFVTSFLKLPDTVYGKGIPQMMKANQDTINACRRSAINNMAISSGPQIAIDKAKISSKQDITQIIPFGIWQYDSSKGAQQGKPFETFTVPNYAEQLTKYEDYIHQRVDNETNIPRYESGNPNVGGAALTARGLSMLMSAATKTIRAVIKNIDEDVIIPLIQRLYNYNMLYSDDPAVKGDLQIRARGIFNLGAEEQAQTAQLEFLQMALQNQQVSEMLGAKGLARLFRPIIKKLKLPADDIIPTEEEIEMREQMRMDRERKELEMQEMQAQADAQMQNEKAQTEGVKRTSQMQGQINNAVAQGIIAPVEAREAMTQL